MLIKQNAQTKFVSYKSGQKNITPVFQIMSLNHKHMKVMSINKTVNTIVRKNLSLSEMVIYVKLKKNKKGITVRVHFKETIKKFLELVDTC